MAFVLNPFLGDVNPGTPEGLKLYNRAIAAPDEKLSIGQQNARDIITAFELDASNFGWGPAINSVQIDATSDPETWHILTQARQLNLEVIQ